MTPLRVGIIGCGGIAQSAHLRTLSRMRDVEVVALADPDPVQMEMARRHAPRAVAGTRYQDLLQRPDVTAVLICTPPASHAEVAVAAFECGKHVYLEKPIATDGEEAQAIVAAWRRAGVVGMIGFNYRCNPLYQAVRRHLAAGRLGTLVGVRSVFCSPERTLPDWKHTQRKGGGVLLELASHHIDLLRFFLQQEVNSVEAHLRSPPGQGNSAVLQLQMADGLPVQSLFSLTAIDEDRFEIYGQRAKLAVDRYRSSFVDIIDAGAEFSALPRVMRGVRSVVHRTHVLRKLLSAANEPSYSMALRHFVDAVRGKHPAVPDLVDGCRSLAVICAAEQSALTGKAVAVATATDEDGTR